MWHFPHEKSIPPVKYMTSNSFSVTLFYSIHKIARDAKILREDPYRCLSIYYSRILRQIYSRQSCFRCFRLSFKFIKNQHCLSIYYSRILRQIYSRQSCFRCFRLSFKFIKNQHSMWLYTKRFNAPLFQNIITFLVYFHLPLGWFTIRDEGALALYTSKHVWLKRLDDSTIYGICDGSLESLVN